MDISEYLSIRDATRNLPAPNSTDREDLEHVRREKEVIKRRIGRLCAQSDRLRAFIDENVASFRGTEGDARSFDALHELLEDQVYRLAYWRVAAEEINYRRFFDVNELAGLRTEDPKVFDLTHALIFRWVREGGVTGLRIDHPDGLADPLGYFRRLQERLFLRACRERLEAEGRGTSGSGSWRCSASGIAPRSRRTRRRRWPGGSRSSPRRSSAGARRCPATGRSTARSATSTSTP